MSIAEASCDVPPCPPVGKPHMLKKCKLCGKLGETPLSFRDGSRACRQCEVRRNSARITAQRKLVRESAPPKPPVTEKTCHVCGKTGPLEDFKPNENLCRPCGRAERKAHYRENKSRWIELYQKREVEQPGKRRQRRAELHQANREKELAQTKAWIANNRESHLAGKRQYRRDNITSLLAIEAEYRKKNDAKIKKSMAAWRQTERGKLVQKLCSFRRREKLAKAGKVTVDELDAIRKAAKGRCHYCREKRKLTYDHVQPVSKNGPNEKWNFVMACKSCNSRKRSTPPEVYARKIGLLLI